MHKIDHKVWMGGLDGFHVRALLVVYKEILGVDPAVCSEEAKDGCSDCLTKMQSFYSRTNRVIAIAEYRLKPP